MGFGTKINFAFIAIILVMVATQAGFAFFIDFNKSRKKAEEIIDPVLRGASAEVMSIYRKNFELAVMIEADPEFKEAFQARDRAGVAQAIKKNFDRVGFSGYATIILENAGQVFYSSDTPSKFGYSAQAFNKPLVQRAFNFRGPAGPNNTFPFGLCALSNTDTCTLSSLVPIRQQDKVPAVLAVSTPFGAELLQGMERKIKLSNDNLKDFDMAYFVMLNTRVTACSSNLANAKPGYLARLSHIQNDPFNDKSSTSESDGRMWRNLPIWGPDNKHALGQVIACSPVQSGSSNLFALAAQIGISAGAAFLLSCLFTAGLSSRFNASMRFLKQRAKDLAANKQDLPSLGSLSGDWYELAEMMDTAMTNPRAVIINLKQTVAKQSEELSERQRQVDAINSQLEAVNRQLTAHNRQALEVSTQVQSANKQAIQIQQKLEAVLQCSTEGFLLLDPYGSVLAANPIFLNWTGVPEREVTGKSCFDLVRKHGENPNTASLIFANPSSGPADLINQFYPEGVIYNRYQNKQVEVMMHLQPVVGDDGNISSYIMVLRDKSLHAEVARLRNEIVTMLTQDIRAPLASAETRWKNIMSNQIQGLNPNVAQQLLEMHEVYEQMLGVVDSYLMMYGGFVPPQEQAPKEQVSVTRLIGECLEQVSQKARAQQIMLDYKTVTGLPSTAMNKEIVQDIIVQLLEKMISVTAPGGRVRAETTVKGKEIRLIISSSGPALQQIEIEEMFVGFIDGRHSEDTYQIRLSMYLARNNAERLGGRIWAESEAGRGTAIFLTLPVS
ncbi:MAG: PAS domain-containing protein [Candidatus Obscuribacterales bacterium]|nr:PAS domain-containing protein [Candidatus Obscuribacterales bacterium]